MQSLRTESRHHLIRIPDVVLILVLFSTILLIPKKKGKNVEILRKKLNKTIYIFADSPNLEDFVKNIFNNVQILGVDTVNIMGSKVITVLISEKDKALALGKKKAHLRLAKELLKVKFNTALNLKTKVTF